ncbi:MAG: biopolymer transporter ExbD [Oscillospiraceae bacterium]|nr:biopolymer transporter ExbD [Oscillospiraceae bacterium]
MRCEIDDEAVSLDMTPIIDCVFLLLIFFLVATTMKKIDHEMPIELPEVAQNVLLEVQQPDEWHIIGVTAEGEYWLDGRVVGQGMLHDEIRGLSGIDPAIKIRVDVDRAAPFRDAMMVLELLRFERMLNVSLHVKKRTR